MNRYSILTFTKRMSWDYYCYIFETVAVPQLGSPLPRLLGALEGGPPMSPVDFKKWQCPLSLF